MKYIKKTLFLFLFVWLTGACTRPLSRTEKVNLVIQKAKSYTGTPYKYGGTTRTGIDCSALIFHAYRSVNINLPRTSKAQSKKGKKVRFKKLRKGDLVFFATGKKRRKITHAGIVTAIRGRKDVRFIHASSSLGVIESNLYSPYYLKRFRQARRIL